MVKYWLLRLHRWLALAFAAPLAVILVTGLILSVEPIVQTTGIRPGSLTAEQVDGWFAQHDPKGQARGVAFRAYENRLTLLGVGEDGATDIDVTNGRVLEEDGSLSGLFGASRGLHERLIHDLDWLVAAATAAMLTILAIGAGMGWPRLRNSVSGWHQGLAWFGLPLLVASPLTGLFLVYGVTFAPAPARVGPAPPIREAVRIVAREKDLATLIWLRPRGGRLLVRLNENGMFNAYAVTREGLVATPKNWPRLFHEGNFAGIWSGGINVAISLALIGLLGTGFVIWARRKLRPRQRQRQKQAAPAPAE